MYLQEFVELYIVYIFVGRTGILKSLSLVWRAPQITFPQRLPTLLSIAMNILCYHLFTQLAQTSKENYTQDGSNVSIHISVAEATRH